MAPSSQEKNQAKSNGHNSTDLEGEKNEWKFRAPYKVHEKDENFNALYEGSCHCGKVQYQLSREKPLDAKYCHCSTCQTLHGAPFQWAAIFEKSDINFTHGHHDLSWYDSASKSTHHTLPCKVSCSHCRSPIMDEGRNMILLFPSLIKFKGKEEQENFRPSCHMFYGQRCVDVRDGLPKWEGMSKDSHLMDEGEGEDHTTEEKEMAEKKEKEAKKEQEKEGEDQDGDGNGNSSKRQKKSNDEGNSKRKREQVDSESEESGEENGNAKSTKLDGGKKYDLR